MRAGCLGELLLFSYAGFVGCGGKIPLQIPRKQRLKLEERALELIWAPVQRRQALGNTI